MEQHHVTLGKGFVGTAVSVGAGLFSWFELAERGLRVVSLLVGITVGVLTGISIYRRMRREAREAKK